MEQNNNGSLCGAYLQDAEKDRAYYEIFFQMCRKFHVDWAAASEKEKAFVVEVTRVTYERSCAAQTGATQKSVRPAFTA